MKYIVTLFLSYTFCIHISFSQNLTPAQIVQKQVDAYNQRSLEVFLESYSDSIKIFKFPNKLLFSGKAQMRERYKKSFESTPELHSTLINRTILGNIVIDNEYIVTSKDKPATELLVIYKIKNQKIIEMYWLRKED